MTEVQNDQQSLINDSNELFQDAQNTEQPTGQEKAEQEVKNNLEQSPKETTDKVDKSEATSVVNDEKYEKEDWIRKRLNRQEQRHRREMQEMMLAVQRQQVELAALLSGKQNNQPTAQDNTNPLINGQQNIAQFNAQGALTDEQKIEFALAKRDLMQKRQAFVNEEQNLQDKYGDYYDVAAEARPYLTENMILALQELPKESIENFYLAWKENPRQIMEISQLSPLKQSMELARLDAKLAAGRVKQSSQSSPQASQKIISPIKPAASSGKSFLDQSFEDMTAEYRQTIKG